MVINACSDEYILNSGEFDLQDIEEVFRLINAGFMAIDSVKKAVLNIDFHFDHILNTYVNNLDSLRKLTSIYSKCLIETTER